MNTVPVTDPILIWIVSAWMGSPDMAHSMAILTLWGSGFAVGLTLGMGIFEERKRWTDSGCDRSEGPGDTKDRR